MGEQCVVRCGQERQYTGNTVLGAKPSRQWVHQREHYKATVCVCLRERTRLHGRAGEQSLRARHHHMIAHTPCATTLPEDQHLRLVTVTATCHWCFSRCALSYVVN